MSAFNDLNSVPASANPFTLTTVLRDEWRFDGVVVTDYKSVTELINHRRRGRCGRRRATGADRRRRHGDGQPVLRHEGRRLVKSGTAGDRGRRRGRAPRAAHEAAGGVCSKDPYANEAGEKATIMRPNHRTRRAKSRRGRWCCSRTIARVLPLSPQSAGWPSSVRSPTRHRNDGQWTGDGKEEDVVTSLDGIRAAGPGTESGTRRASSWI